MRLTCQPCLPALQQSKKNCLRWSVSSTIPAPKVTLADNGDILLGGTATGLNFDETTGIITQASAKITGGIYTFTVNAKHGGPDGDLNTVDDGDNAEVADVVLDIRTAPTVGSTGVCRYAAEKPQNRWLDSEIGRFQSAVYYCRALPAPKIANNVMIKPTSTPNLRQLPRLAQGKAIQFMSSLNHRRMASEFYGRNRLHRSSS